jgi:hypothetical protein
MEAKVTKLPAPRVSRHVTGNVKLVRQHARHVGELIIAWNRVQSAMFDLFWVIIGKDRHALAHAIWHTIQSDKNQREMLVSAATATLVSEDDKDKKRVKANAKTLDHIKWITNMAHQLSPYRNDPAHANIMFSSAGGSVAVVPDFASTRWAVLDRLTEKPTAQMWQRVRGDLYAVADFAVSLRISLTDPDWPYALPARPKLRVAQEKNAKGGPASRLRRKARPKSPPKASRG